jgi:hypothetical protein
MTKMEKQVIKNSLLLDKIFDKLIKENENKYVTFHNDKYFISDSFKSAYDTGIIKFGYSTGFVLKKLTKEIPIMSNLVEL